MVNCAEILNLQMNTTVGFIALRMDDMQRVIRWRFLLRIVVYFGSGRPAIGHSPQAIWIFKDVFMVPLERRIGSLLSEQVEWQ